MSTTLLSGRYRLECVLGQGGMGQVHLAHDSQLQRRVAIKMLPADAESDPHARARLRREALAIAAIDHPFICKIHEVGEDEGRTYIVMEYVEGRTLDGVARDGGLTPRDLLNVAHEVSQALDEAHRRGVVHRDLKPSNIMVTAQGHAKVLDFGLAKQTHPQSAQETGSGALTDPGIRLGTPAYMSPEQVLGSPLDPRSDVFSLGTVLHELASGRHPFLKGTTSDTMAAILRDPPSSTEGDLDVVPGFGRVVHRMLAKACAERFQTMGELNATLDQLRQGGSSSRGSSGSAVLPAAGAERTPFVARDHELAELTAAIDRMLLGQGGLVLLGGEPGVGKTRLAREAQRLAHQRGCFLLTGQCYEQEGAPPFGPFAEQMEYSARLLPQALRAALGDGAAEIASMVPSLRKAYADIPPAAVVPADQQRRLIFNAYLEYTRRASQKSAVVALFDDLHWADESTLQLLLHLAPHLQTMRVLAIGTYRDVELDTERPFAKTLETLLRQRLATRISVKRLSASGVEQMLSTMSGSPPPSSLVRIVYEETDGNAFFVEEVFQHLKEEGKIFDEQGRWKADLKADEIDVPEGVRLVVSRRLERLGEQARKALTAAAVIGRSFPLDLLVAVADLSEDAVLDIVEEAERAQLLVAERGRQPRYTFVHELIRSTLVSAMALPRRQRLHVRVADAIERLRAASLDGHLSMLAHHLYQAGAAVEPERATKFLMQAMTRALESGAFEETLELSGQLLSLDIPSGTQEHGLIEDARARALFALARPRESAESALRAFTTWIERKDDAGIERAAFAAAPALVVRGHIDEMFDVVNKAIAALSPSAERERCRLQAFYASWITGAHRFDEAEEIFAAAKSVAERLGDPDARAAVLLAQANLARQLGRISESLEHSQQGLSLLADTALADRADAYWLLTLAMAYTGRFDAVVPIVEAGQAVAARAGHSVAQWAIRRAETVARLHRSGALRQQREESERELQHAAQWPFVTRTVVAIRSFELGEVHGALDIMRTAIAEQPAKTFMDCLPEVNLFAMHAWAGQHDDARAMFPALAGRLARAGQRNLHGQWAAATVAVHGLALVGDQAACGALYPAVREYVDLGHRTDAWTVGPTTPLLAAAVAAQAAGQPERARDHFEQALRLADELPSVLLQPSARYWFGRHLASRADADSQARAQALLSEAADQFHRLEMVIHEQHAVHCLKSPEHLRT